MQSGEGKGQRFAPLYPPIMKQAVKEEAEKDEKGEDIKVAIIDLGGVKRGVLVKPGVPIRAPALYPDPPTEPKCGSMPPSPNLLEGGKKVAAGKKTGSAPQISVSHLARAPSLIWKEEKIWRRRKSGGGENLSGGEKRARI